jgi:hypothetical protein
VPSKSGQTQKKLAVDRFQVKNRGENLGENFLNLTIKESPTDKIPETLRRGISESPSACCGHTFQVVLAMKLNHGRDLKGRSDQSLIETNGNMKLNFFTCLCCRFTISMWPDIQQNSLPDGSCCADLHRTTNHPIAHPSLSSGPN